jgi:hypothetical protein
MILKPSSFPFFSLTNLTSFSLCVTLEQDIGKAFQHWSMPRK